MRRLFLLVLLLVYAPVYAPAHAADDLTGRQILEKAVAAMGGDAWLSPRTLTLSGRAVFYAPDRAAPVSTADGYRMWREMNPGRTVSHGADGKVRITATNGEKLMFDVGFDGTHTWTEKGILPKAEADAFWASNFGFGIIRQALGEGFRIERAPDSNVEGHAIWLIRIIGPDGGATLFGVDKENHYVRCMGFGTPRGFHVRTYGDFLRMTDPDWVQAREVTLYYNGVKQNVVYWKDAQVNAPLPENIFSPPGQKQ